MEHGVSGNGESGGNSRKYVVIVAGIGGKQFYDTLAVVSQAVLGSRFMVVPEMDLEIIQQYGVTITPAVVVDGRVMCQGRVPEEDEIRKWISSNMNR